MPVLYLHDKKTLLWVGSPHNAYDDKFLAKLGITLRQCVSPDVNPPVSDQIVDAPPLQWARIVHQRGDGSGGDWGFRVLAV